MSESDHVGRIIRFGIFEVDLGKGEVRKDGLRIRLQQQPFQVLSSLLQRPGQTVSREELCQKLWPGSTRLNFGSSLKTAVNKVRQVLGDSGRVPRYVETLSRRGYRFIAPVEGPRQALPSAQEPNGGRIRVAVLPFENLSPDAQLESFSEGITEELITQIGRLYPKQLGVIARTSALKYKHSEKHVDRIGQELGVDYILEGSARSAADRVRVNVQLIQVKDETYLWAETYERDLKDILAVQSGIARRIARSMAVQLLAIDKNPSQTDDRLLLLAPEDAKRS